LKVCDNAHSDNRMGGTNSATEHGSKVTDLTLDAAAVGENVEILRLLIRASQVKPMGDRGAAILGQAARSRKTDLVRFLLDSGAGVNSRSRGQGWTPLLSAVNSGQFYFLLCAACATPSFNSGSSIARKFFSCSASAKNLSSPANCARMIPLRSMTTTCGIIILNITGCCR
jgi:hypothetical protein